MIIDRVDEEFLLFSLHPDGRWVSPKEGSVRDGLAAAWLAELLVDGRIKIKGDRIYHRGHTPMEDDVLDPILAEIRAGRPRKPGAWIGRLVGRTRRAIPQVMARLERRGYVEHVRRRGAFGRRKDLFPQHNRLAREELMRHLEDVLAGRVRADDSTLALLAVLDGAGMTGHVFGPTRRDFAHVRVQELLRQDPRLQLLGEAVRARSNSRWLHFLSPRRDGKAGGSRKAKVARA